MAILNTNVGPERVQTFDQPIGTVQVPGAATAVVGMLISTSKVGAPINSPVRVRNLAEFEAAFGDDTEVFYNGYSAAQGYWDNAGSGAVMVVVAVSATAGTANEYIGSGSLGTGVRALDSVDDLTHVMAPGLPLAKAYLVQPVLIAYAETVRAEFDATLTTVFSIMAIPKEIQSATKDELFTGAAVVDSLNSTSITVGVGQAFGATAGMIVTNLAATYTGVISAVAGDVITLSPNPTGSFVATDTAFISTPSAVNYKEVVINYPSRVNAWYFNNVLVSTSVGVVAVDPVGHVAGVMARMDGNLAIGGVSHAPAGIRYAGIAGISGLGLALSERIDGEELRLAFINRITSFPGAGNVIFGGYTAESGSAPIYTPDEQLIQVMRTLQYIKRSLDTGLRAFLWENFSPATQAQVQGAILAFLRSNSYLFPAGLAEDQQFKVISIEPTQGELDQGLLRVRVQVRPNKAVRFIEIALEYPIPVA